MKTLKYSAFFIVISALAFLSISFQSCSTFSYKTYEEQKDVDDPEPNYEMTLDPEFQEYTSYMFIGNRIENFGTYFNTFFNARENFDEAYEDYETRVLSTYNERLDSIFATPNLSQEAKDKFGKAIEKASKVIQYHKSSAFMDHAVLLIGKCYFYLGDYLKAERKFGEFVSKLSRSVLLDEALLFLARTQLRLGNSEQALATLNNLIKNSKDKQIVAGAYQSLGEYYIDRKDFETSLKHYRNSIDYSNDKEFKAQMQFLIASVTARQNPLKGAAEFEKVMDYSTSFELEYLARYNHLKNKITGSSFSGIPKMIDELRVDYKEYPEYLSDIEYLAARYFEQKKDYKNAVKYYKEVIVKYPKTMASSDASFSIANYYENVAGDYLTALKYYNYSQGENLKGRFAKTTEKKIAVYKRYFELMSIIKDREINTDYDTLFLRELQPDLYKEGQEFKNEGQNKGKGEDGGEPGLFLPGDSLNTQLDTNKQKEEAIIKAKFELAELFIYDLAKPDSAEKYLDEAYKESGDYDFKSKVLFALAVLYKNNELAAKYEQTLNTIINEYPLSPVANECRRLLGIPVVADEIKGADDSIFSHAETKFLNSEYPEALDGFIKIAADFPGSKFYTRSAYAAGWIYENVLDKPDSAVFYYTKVAEGTPPPEFYNLAVEKLTLYENSVSGSNDTLNNITDTSKTSMPENKNEPPGEDQLLDDTNPENQKLPKKNIEIKKEEDGELDGSGEDPVKPY